MADLFGESDSDDDVTTPYQRTVATYDSLSDSEDEGFGSAKKSKILKKKSGSSSSSAKAAAASSLFDDSDDSDDGKAKSKKLDKKKKRKHLDDAKGSKSKHSDDRNKKRSKRDKSKPSKKDSASNDVDGEVSSGDAYDSGEEAVRNKEDDAFLASDSDDELRAVAKEYDEDEQNFDDEKPNSSKLKTKKPSNTSRSSGGTGGKDFKDLDPMTQTLETIKKPKATAMGDNDKARIVTDLLRKMDIACRLDEEAYRNKQPALHKLQMLKAVESIVEIKTLQATLLEYDILSAFRDWLEPKEDNTLPSLEVRTSIYRMLLNLPCQVEHLKRAAPGKQPIGITIVALRKHKMETETNKRMLKEIMEKWSRPVFGKSVDPRGTSNRENPELRELAAQRFYSQQMKSMAATSPRSPRQSSAEDGDIFTGSNGDSSPRSAEGFARLRASCPQSGGFLFTVQPEYKISSQDASAAVSKPPAAKSDLGETREKLLKIMKENKTVPTGKKQNIKAINVTLTGRNKA